MKKQILIKLDETDPKLFTHITYNEVVKALERDTPEIVTPIISCFSQRWVARGYEVWVHSKDAQICLNKLISNKEIRPAQNAEKMLRNGCFGFIHKEAYGDEEIIVTIEDVANYFLSKKRMSNKKLQLLCYYAYAWHLNIYETELFENKFEAWVNGPIDSDLYNKYAHYRYKDITDYDNVYIPNETKQFLDRIFICYDNLTSGELEQLSYIEDPWLKTRGKILSFEPSNRLVKKELIEKYYIKKYGNILEKNVDFEKIIKKSWDYENSL